MSPQPLSVIIAPHLQRALEVMGRDMAVEPQALVNQAVFAWLRINGYVVPGTAGDVARAAEVSPAAAPQPSLAEHAVDDDAPVRAERPEPPSAADDEEDDEDDDEDDDDDDDDADDEVGDEAVDADERDPAAAAPAASDEDDEQTSSGPLADGADTPPVHEGTFVVKSAPVALFIERDGEEPVRVESDVFVIGRGATCDLVIDSPRVSREHVRVSRQGLVFVLEDLGSSNGTWLGDDRVERRELEDGDEIALGNELVRFSLRAG